MTLQELNEYVREIISDQYLQETCRFSIEENGGEWFQSFGREDGDLVRGGVYYDRYGTIIIEISGGLNGSGDWKEYLSGISEVLAKLEELPEVDNAYIVDIINDCPDDVFYPRIGLSPVNEDDFEE